MMLSLQSNSKFKPEKPKYRRLRIRMQQKFEDFDVASQESFIKDLCLLTGVVNEEIKNIVFRPGCVIFEGDLNESAVEKLLEMYEVFNKIKKNEDVIGLREFLEKHSIVSVTDELVKTFAIIKNIRSKKEANNQVVFIHGWNGDRDSFGAFPEYIESTIDCRCLIYDYPTGILEKSPSIMYLSSNLENWLNNYVKASNVAIIAHSMGGIVTRKFIVREHWRKQPFNRRIKHISFIASPHNGATFASLGKKIPFISKKQLEEISPNSPFIFELNDQWTSWCNDNVPNGCSVRSLFGTNDNIVSTNNAKGLDINAIPILNADHTGIVKPISANDEVVVTISRLLKEAGFNGDNVTFNRPYN